MVLYLQYPINGIKFWARKKFLLYGQKVIQLQDILLYCFWQVSCPAACSVLGEEARKACPVACSGGSLEKKGGKYGKAYRNV